MQDEHCNQRPHTLTRYSTVGFRGHAKFILYGAGVKGDGTNTFWSCIEAGHKYFFCHARCGTHLMNVLMHHVAAQKFEMACSIRQWQNLRPMKRSNNYK